MMAAMKRAIVLGAGRVGAVMARDMAADYQVTVADVRPDVLERVAGERIRTVRTDLADPEAVKRVVADHDVVLGALASAIGLQTLRAVIEAGRPYVDISFMPEDGRQLAELAREKGVTCVIDCGVAPGLSNLLAGHASLRLAPCESIDICVGGLPVERRWPYEYAAPFAPSDVIEEYVRPARLRENGRVVVKEALTEPELLTFDGIGTLEAFNTDGLRSLLDLDIPNARERTLRYPGHAEIMRILRHTGFFSQEPIEVRGQKVRPLDVTSALLFPRWSFFPRQPDFTVMRIIAVGTEAGRRVKLEWDLLDHYDRANDNRSMSRTTGFPATIVARLVAEGRFSKPGVFAPESLAAEAGLLDHLLTELDRRGVHLTARIGAA
jgi:lysine 6-dehydrogenase